MNEEKNPWDVKNIQEFSFLNCPECNFKTKTETIFQDHAVENHTKSRLHDISTPNFPTPIFSPGFSTPIFIPGLFNHELFNHGLFKVLSFNPNIQPRTFQPLIFQQ